MKQQGQSTSQLVSFNINDHVKIRVTAKGLDQWDARQSQYPPEYRRQLPVDPDGYTRLQLWEVMNCWGCRCYNGCEIPFETQIVLGEQA